MITFGKQMWPGGRGIQFSVELVAKVEKHNNIKRYLKVQYSNGKNQSSCLMVQYLNVD